MPKYSISLTPSLGDGIITYSKNYRILTLDESIKGMKSVSEVSDILNMGSAQVQYLQKSIRYSLDNNSFSLWYDYTMGADMIRTIAVDPNTEVFFQFRYEYNDNTTDPLAQPIVINEIKLIVDYDLAQAPLDPDCQCEGDTTYKRYTLKCQNEMCPLVAFDRKSIINPYDVGPAMTLYTDMSFYVNNLFGLDTVYFKSEPDKSSGDFIFKEWTMNKITDRKCCKILLPGNKFPDNKWMFDQVGMKFEEPFEVHLDKNYFEGIFGPLAEPRINDFLYFPMLNRMFEIKGAYLYRGFMMKPVYWKVSLSIFRPNINYVMNGEDKMFLENNLLDAEKIFKTYVEEEVADARMPQQYATQHKTYDKIRYYLNKNLVIRSNIFYFNYADLIDYYYDLSTTSSSESAVEYNAHPMFGGAAPNVSFSCMFNTPSAGSFNLLQGRDEVDANGMKVSGQLNNSGRLDLTLLLNGNPYRYTVEGVLTNRWYCVILSMSSQYKQVGMHFYDMPVDPADQTNHNNMILVKKSTLTLLANSEFSLDNDKYLFKGSKIRVACVRIFNRLIEEEKHTFVLSQLFLKEESMLQMIDNCRPRIDAPFVTRNR